MLSILETNSQSYSTRIMIFFIQVLLLQNNGISVSKVKLGGLQFLVSRNLCNRKATDKSIIIAQPQIFILSKSMFIRIASNLCSLLCLLFSFDIFYSACSFERYKILVWWHNFIMALLYSHKGLGGHNNPFSKLLRSVNFSKGLLSKLLFA